MSVTKSKRNVNEKKDEKRALKGSKNLWLSENTTSPIWTTIFAEEDAAKKGAVSSRQLYHLILIV